MSTLVVARVAALALIVTGLFVALLSFATWSTCPTTPCGGPLQAFSEYSGTDLGFGIVTAVAGLGLVALGADALRHGGMVRSPLTAVLLSLVVSMTAEASVAWMYLIPGDFKGYASLPSTSIMVGGLGLVALVISIRQAVSDP